MKKRSDGDGMLRFTGVAFLLAGLVALGCSRSLLDVAFVVVLLGGTGIGCLALAGKYAAWEARTQERLRSLPEPGGRVTRLWMLAGAVIGALGGVLTFWHLEWGFTVCILGAAIFWASVRDLLARRPGGDG